MHRWGCWFFVLAAACTERNPLDCSDGTCTDPAHPFCDVNGTLGGGTYECIAPTCTPGAFAECRGDTEVRCDTQGTSFNTVLCERGCSTEAQGCRLCDPGETVCANGTVQSCDAAGNVVSSSACPLGCFEDQPRCRDIDPSNNLASYLDMSATAPDLDLSAGGTIFTDTGVVRDAADNAVDVPTFLFSPQVGGSSIRVIVANRVTIGDVNVSIQHPANPENGPALAILANGVVTISGTLTTTFVNDGDGGKTAGGVTFASCIGGHADDNAADVHMQEYWSGSGGGGHATRGGRGGGVGDGFVFAGAPGGGASGNPTLVPLRGGCGGGASHIQGAPGSAGGGAVQISSRASIAVTAGTINMNGTNGNYRWQGPMSPWGGGAGGGILLEAPVVLVGVGSRLLANGGGGASAGGGTDVTSLTTAPTPGGPCTSTATSYCTPGGNGAAVDGQDVDADDTAYNGDPAAVHSFYGGAGGGGMGYIRINTPTATYTKDSNAIESGVLTTGTLGTR